MAHPPDFHDPETCPDCVAEGKLSTELRNRILAQLKEWGLKPSPELAVALLALAADAVDTTDPESFAWYILKANHVALIASAHHAKLKREREAPAP